ncbi:MAG: EamA family transporter [Bacteroidia bacterium]|nr:EamA family transporter [Bacteroidia bacterium]MCX7651599.1 EamA family transporter [Bacteroidia bacterium]MDW8417316.1 EamA family transporter [Bacteroidia bacterium]
MIFVIGSILTNVLLLLWLRILRVPTPALVTLNYFVCVSLAAILDTPRVAELWRVEPVSLMVMGILGGLFISIFILTGESARTVGVGLTGMLTKLSVILPISFAALFLNEPLSPRQSVGLAAGLGAILAIHAPYLRGGKGRSLIQALRIGLLLWLGNGVIDILFKAFHPKWKVLSPLHIPLIIMSVAGILGVFWHGYQRRLSELFHSKTWLSAILLGGTNLLSIYFYLRGLETLPAVQFFLWNNLGIVLLSGMIGIVFFREKLSWEVSVGYVLGIGAIILTV